MQRHEAKQIAETVTIQDLRQMFLNAQNSIKDWTTASRVNKGLSLGVAFNILSQGIGDHTTADNIHILAKTNMIREFGEYLPGYEKPARKLKSTSKVQHQDPVFLKNNP